VRGQSSIQKRFTTTAPLLAFLLQGVAMHPPDARAGELDAFDGRLESNNDGAETYSWGVEYREPFSSHFSGGFLWLNEGHLPNNHRDGQAVQIWWRSKPEPIGLVFDLGLGPYRYYDTHLMNSDPGYEDRHGWGGVASASLDWYFRSRWFVFLRANQVDTSQKYDSSSLDLGFGYRFASLIKGTDASGNGEPATNPHRWEFDGMFGQRIANTDHSETGLAESLDVRWQMSEHFVASASLISGQDTKLDWGAGFAVQVWLQQQLTPKFTVAAGAGAFIVSEDNNLENAQSPSNLEALISISLAYAITPHWVARGVWHRLGTGDDHDADIWLLGIGYKL
jgi:hypothetical protein